MARKPDPKGPARPEAEDAAPRLGLGDMIDRPGPPKARKAPARRKPQGPLPWWRRIVRYLLRGALALVIAAFVVVGIGRWVNPPQTFLMRSEAARLGEISQSWVPLARISPQMRRAVVAAEDANFCLHGGFDMAELRRAIEDGGQRGASTITQQVAKNVYLWPARSWVRKALEALITPMIELTWPKWRILEVYLNVAEFGEGVFGAEAAARAIYNTSAARLEGGQAAMLAAVLPDPRGRDPRRPSPFVQLRAARIAAGADLIARDERSGCLAPEV